MRGSVTFQDHQSIYMGSFRFPNLRSSTYTVRLRSNTIDAHSASYVQSHGAHSASRTDIGTVNIHTRYESMIARDSLDLHLASVRVHVHFEIEVPSHGDVRFAKTIDIRPACGKMNSLPGAMTCVHMSMSGAQSFCRMQLTCQEHRCKVNLEAKSHT